MRPVLQTHSDSHLTLINRVRELFFFPWGTMSYHLITDALARPSSYSHGLLWEGGILGRKPSNHFLYPPKPTHQNPTFNEFSSLSSL